jgi:hypothetical protein
MTRDSNLGTPEWGGSTITTRPYTHIKKLEILQDTTNMLLAKSVKTVPSCISENE